MVNWGTLIKATIHPTKVDILEAMARLTRPVSSAELHRMFADGEDLSNISYHMSRLVDLGAVEEIDSRPVRGARETFYFLTAAMTTVREPSTRHETEM